MKPSKNEEMRGFDMCQLLQACSKPDPKTALIDKMSAWEDHAQAQPDMVSTKAFRQFFQVCQHRPTLTVRILKNESVVGAMPYRQIRANGDTSGHTFSVNATPGAFLIELSTGRLLWEGDLTEAVLILSDPLHGNLKLAADTGERSEAQEIPLLDGQLLLRVIPGELSGTLEMHFIP